MKVFLDTNILLDVLAKRKEFYDASARVWTGCEQGELEGCISVVSFVTCYYVVRKYGGRAAAEKANRLLRDLFAPVDLTGDMVGRAIEAGLKDFEDAIQHVSAVVAQSAYLITRDPHGFPTTPVLVVSPAEFAGILEGRAGGAQRE